MPAIIDQSVIDTDLASKVYSIDFRAASPGQMLTVTFSSSTSTFGVGLQAATLSQHLPAITVTSPAAAQAFQAPAMVPVTVGATQFDDAVTDIKGVGSEGTILDVAGSVLSTNWGPLPGGHYSLTASATDAAGLFNTPAPIEFDVIAQGGIFSVQRGDISSPVDLSVAGSADWILWGPLNTGDQILLNPGNVLARKANVEPLISEYRPIGNHTIESITFANGVSFTDSTQNFGSSGSQLLVHDQGDGYEISVPADTTARTLQLYVGASLARGRLTAFLSDGSAPVAVDTTFDDPNGPDFNGFDATSVYTINYSAASAGQTLTLRYTMDFDCGSGEVDLLGAALAGTPVSPSAPLPQITSITPPTAPTNTRVTIAGSNFGLNQGSSSVLFGQQTAKVLNWSDTSVIAIVPSGIPDGNTVQVVVSAPQGFSNSVNFTVPSYKIYPASLNLLVGQSASVKAQDSRGNLVSGLAWAAQDPSIVGLSTDDPPLITGLAAGSTTVYAGDVPFPVTVYAGAGLPPGTPIWSLPLSPGATNVTGLAAAVPSDSGADVLALDDTGTLTAISADGTPAWSLSGISPTANTFGHTIGTINSSGLIPDFTGSALIKGSYSYTVENECQTHLTHKVSHVDVKNLQLVDLYVFSDQRIPGTPLGTAPGCSNQNAGIYTDINRTQIVVPHPAGPVFIQDEATITVIDPATTQTLASIALDPSTLNGQPSSGPHGFGRLIVAGDGNAYVPYTYFDQTTNSSGETFTVHSVEHHMILRVAPDGSYVKTELSSFVSDTVWTQNSGLPGIDPSAVVDSVHITWSGDNGVDGDWVLTNADQGVAVAAGVALPVCASTYFGDYNDGSGNLQTFSQTTGCATDLTPHTEITYVSQDSVGSQVTVALNQFRPGLQREDGSYIGADNDGNLDAVGADGSLLWQQQITDGSGNIFSLTPLYATADAGVIATTTTTTITQPNQVTQVLTKQLGTLYTMDMNGNIVSQAPDQGAVYSWAGSPYGSVLASISRFDFSLAPDQSTFWPEMGGNPTGNGAATVQCPCLFQSLSNSASTAMATQSLSVAAVDFHEPVGVAAAAIEMAAPFSDPTCPICNLTSPDCTVMEGPQSQYLILVGDPGLGEHNAGNLFNLAAQQAANDLHTQGHRVTACRVSSIQDVDNSLLHNGFIDGGVIFFTHGGPFGLFNANQQQIGTASILAVGQGAGANTNITASNSSLLSNVQTAYLGKVPAPGHPDRNIIGPNATVSINGCSAGRDVGDYYAGFTTSIAQQLANNLKRTVVAYKVGMYFSQFDGGHDQRFGPKKGDILPNSLPMYLIPLGPPGHKPGASQFSPQ